MKERERTHHVAEKSTTTSFPPALRICVFQSASPQISMTPIVLSGVWRTARFGLWERWSDYEKELDLGLELELERRENLDEDVNFEKDTSGHSVDIGITMLRECESNTPCERASMRFERIAMLNEVGYNRTTSSM